ncbi:protoporphyrinogen oxidase [Heyndrickxia acidiproducens]|uniref:protoporphyrinogen oxidase n=1 Tax=Heyndrickxia acidiproducens TaxID=1121084 RepID=UPI0004769DBC|nr:protoporphyrinogen oxidase [Heyndrickxia acidiproducens]
MKSIIIIGGGITGLTALYELQKKARNAGIEAAFTLVEESPRLGGKIRTIQHGEFTMETGADSIVARKPGVAAFIEELGLQGRMCHNDTGKSYLYTAGGLKPIPEETVFGIPACLDALFRSELVSIKGKITALKDLFTRNTTFTKDSSAGEFLEAFFGKELVEKQIAPVLSGVYSGDLHELTLATTMPFLVDYKNEYGSIIKGLAAHKPIFLSPERKKFVSFQNGLSEIIDRLEEKTAGAEILKGTKAVALKRRGDSYQLALSGGRKLKADVIVLAVPHTTAQSLLSKASLAHEFHKFKTASLISIYLGFDLPDTVLPGDGTGFIVPKDSDLLCDACTWTSRKWRHTSKNRHLLLRLFYKNTNPELFAKLNAMDKDALVSAALQDVAKALGITGTPVAAEVTKWQDQMPRYDLNHRKTIAALNEKLAVSDPNLILAGCSYYGVGIADCILNGKQTAEKVMARLQHKQQKSGKVSL